MDTNSFPTPFIVTVFYQATAFKQVLCSPSWQKSKGVFASSQSPHARVLCCNAGSKSLKNTAELLEKGSGHSLSSPEWTVTDENAACAPCSVGQFTDKLNLNTQCKFCTKGTEFKALSVACDACGAGRYQEQSTSPSVSCKDCASGSQFKDKETVCDACMDGKYQDQNTAASVTCLTCAAGQFTTDKESPCKNCDDGKIQELAEAVEYTCKFCTAGTSFATTSKACNNCDAGKYQGACLVLFSVSSPPPYF